MSSALDQVTLCIFTLDRHKQTTERVSFYSNFNLRIIILDASIPKNKYEFPVNVNYFHVPGMSLNERLRKFATLVNSDYILLSPDDDFYSKAGIVKTIRFLECNNEYSSAQGLRIRFFETPIFNWIPDYTKQIKLNFNQDDPVQRTLLMGKGMHYIYSVIRTSSYHEIINCLENTDSNSRGSFAITELIFNYCLPVFGKHKVLPHLYQSRKAHKYLGSDVNYSDWINNHSDKSVISLRQNILDLYIVKLNITKESAIEIYSNLTLYFSRAKQAQTSQPYRRKIREVIKILFDDFRIFHLFRKFSLKYFGFYYLLARNRQLLDFILEVRSLLKFLKEK
jgi:glycosyltransferase domain-containing protein